MSPDSAEDEGKLRFTLLENGLDSVLEGLRRLRNDPTPSDLKHSSIALWAGVLLILKERLRQKDWRLLMKKPEAASEHAYASGNFTGPDYPELLERLEEQCGVVLSHELRGHLQGLHARRKRLEHFQVDEGRDEVISSAAQVAGDIMRFIGAELEPGLTEGPAANLIEQIREEINSSELLLEVHLEPVLEELAASRTEALECPRCHRETLAIVDPVRCRFCGYEGASGEARAEEYISNVLGVDYYREVKDGGEWPQFSCLECDAPALVKIETDGGDRFVCLQCCATWEPGSLSRCDRCGALMERDDETTSCPACWGAIFDRKD